MKKLALVGIGLGALGLCLWLALGRMRGGTSGGAETPAGAEVAAAAGAELAPAVSAVPRREPGAAQAQPVAESGSRELEPVPEAARGAKSSFHGVVVDGLSGQPIAGARALIPSSSDGLEISALETIEMAAESTSDASGGFVLAVPPRSRFLAAYVLAEGYGFGSFVVDREGNEPELPARVELLPAAALEFRVRDARGAPLPAAEVALDLVEEEEFGDLRPVRKGKGNWMGTTDAEGLVRFADLPPERVLVWKVDGGDGVKRDQLALGAGEERRIEVVFGGGARIVGVVRDENGVVVPGLRLWLARPGAEQRFTDGRMLVGKARSDELGRFELAELPYEALVLGPTPEQDDFVPRAQPVLVDRAVVDLELVVTRGLAISGRVVGTSAELESLGSVYAQPADGGDGTWGEFHRQGAFRIAPLEPGEYLVYSWGIGGGTEVLRRPAGASDVELHFAVPRKIPIRIVDGGEDFEFRAQDLERGTAEWTSRSTDTFEWSFSRGTYALQATTPDGRVGFLPRLEVGDVEPRGEVVLRLEAGASVTLVHAATSGVRALRLFVDGAPFTLPLMSDSLRMGFVAGAAETLLVPAGELRAELLEDERVVAREQVALLPGERRRILLTPR